MIRNTNLVKLWLFYATGAVLNPSESDHERVAANRLREGGLKPSASRLQVLRVLMTSSERHLDADGVYHRLLLSGTPLGLTTVYKVLAQFELAGLVERRELRPGKRLYELVMTDRQEHGHLVCLKTRQVFEFDTAPLSQALAAVAARHGLSLARVEVTAYGVPTAAGRSTR